MSVRGTLCRVMLSIFAAVFSVDSELCFEKTYGTLTAVAAEPISTSVWLRTKSAAPTSVTRVGTG
ncbi:hypothetical protein [Mycobacterium uberis]|uniref:hypothetical protein n=1 Tax=Mycobacterium uberis TaxID=2162698 RepID=UPI0010589A56|nr:hypothetical protein [Mycobacterium uberis]